MQSNYMYGPWDADTGELLLTQEHVETSRKVVTKQHRMDSFMEASTNIAVGFVISWAVWVWVVAPIFNYDTTSGEGFLVTCIFTVTSLLRQYILRRLFDGKTIWETIRAKIA